MIRNALMRVLEAAIIVIAWVYVRLFYNDEENER